MFSKKPKRPNIKSIRELIDHKSHVQKKYFSLMFVPSYSTGKTRSLRIPYNVFYVGIAGFFLLSTIMAGIYLRSHHFMRVVQDVSAERDQAQEAYKELQTNLANEQNRLRDDADILKSQLNEEQKRYQTERGLVRQEYQDNLEDLHDMVIDMEKQLQELDESRQDVIDKLGSKAYIPPIKAILGEIEETQQVLLAAMHDVRIRSDERNPSTQTTEQDLRDTLAILMSKMETQHLCFTNLTRQAGHVQMLSSNYPTKWPIRGTVSSAFGYRTNPMGGSNSEHHDGIDIRTPTGTNVHATGGGTVRQAGSSGSYGNIVVIDHGGGIRTLYAHNSKLLVSTGQRVERGDIIAKSGSTGRSTGPHVHYEVQVNGIPVDPVSYFLE